MFANYVYEKSSAKYKDRILLIDSDCLYKHAKYSAYFESQGFQVIEFIDDLNFRVEHNEILCSNDDKYLVVAKPGSYIPYDIATSFSCFDISLRMLYPKLNASAIKEYPQMNLDLLCMAYTKNFNNYQKYEETKDFISNIAYGLSNVRAYLAECEVELRRAAETASNHKEWFHAANLKATIDVMATKYDLEVLTEYVHQRFIEYVISDFGKLSSVIDRDGPVLVSRAMEFMHDHSEKYVVIVMDGMSEFDWSIISESFIDLNYEKANTFAMIPTTTSISRQCLISNKYPSQLVEPWKQSKEKSEFVDCAKSFGYNNEQIAYTRGYALDYGTSIKCAAVIINDVDDMVHGQTQGRIGMYNDISVLTKQEKLVSTVKQLLRKGFDVYITADHGNTPCVGVGKLTKTGVEVETKSRRMMVLHDFADKQTLKGQYDLIDYPKYYLNKEYDYLICGAGWSFDAKGEEVMSHGGITVDEVIVPFIKIKAEDNNG